MSTRTIAIVDDDQSMRISVARLLRAHGFATRTFASAEAVLDCNATADIDCFVLDINLDGISGIELRRRLISRHSYVPTIFMTALDGEAVHQDALRSGCVAYLHKPFLGHSLVDAIKTAMEDRK